jgi:hypothetical protein
VGVNVGFEKPVFSSLEMDYEKMNESLHCHVSILLILVYEKNRFYIRR